MRQKIDLKAFWSDVVGLIILLDVSGRDVKFLETLKQWENLGCVLLGDTEFLENI